MDRDNKKYSEASVLFAYNGGGGVEGVNGLCNTSTKNPFLDSFSDPICNLNLQETSEFVKSFPVANNGAETRGFLEMSSQRNRDNGENSATRRSLEAPPTPGRPIFSFSTGNFSRKNVPSKWDDAEKWLVSGSSCIDSPAHNSHGLLKPLEPSRMLSKQSSGYRPQLGEIFAEKSRVTAEENVSKVFSTFHGSSVLDHHRNSTRTINGVSLSASADLLLKDKFTNEVKPVCPKFGDLDPLKEGFLFGDSIEKSMDDRTHEVKHRDIGTEMTPLGSSTTSRCPTPFKSTSPARHNTPADRSGPLSMASMDSSNTIDITQFQECHLAKLHHGSKYDTIALNWSSREEEEEDISKSLRHFEMNCEFRKSVSGSRTCVWDEEENTKSCLRYQREEAKIQAWVNLQSAKAEAESRKLEVKIQKMKSDLEEKLMKRMADVHRKAEEWRAEAKFQHSEQILKTGQQARKGVNRVNSKHSGDKSCGCFPCNKYHI
ncbi:uncharacterized protein [Primulina eburnea]|uniref:uncharacterized protein n=1 Tax=Primulina eburnea TaxID=1245227 RepID=UPI003C6C3018